MKTATASNNMDGIKQTNIECTQNKVHDIQWGA